MIARELISLPAYAEEVELGLASSPKTLPCKLFYDREGSALFERITLLPEYYLTRSELEILRDQSDEIVGKVHPGVTVIELGAGSAAKTTTLLQAFSRRQLRVAYVPVDISPTALAEARRRVESECTSVSVRPMVADFARGFEFLRNISGRKLVLYLGSSIGNFDPGPAVEMLGQIREQLAEGDRLLLGTDLAKDPAILVPAYDDSQGVTEQFDKNILARLNRELGAHFNLDLFRHLAIWNPEESRMEIYLESLQPQTVSIDSLNAKVVFAKGERIHTESSYKYSMQMVCEMLKRSGYLLEATWFDRRAWFGLHLARAV